MALRQYLFFVLISRWFSKKSQDLLNTEHANSANVCCEAYNDVKEKLRFPCLSKSLKLGEGDRGSQTNQNVAVA